MAVLCLWSGPRNISTAMMRSFGSRADTTCWDEPFFAPFLTLTSLDHPGRAETLAACETDPDAVAERVLAPVPTPHHFQKHMAHHMVDGIPREWIASARHVLILRHPAHVIASYAKGRAAFDATDLGFAALRDIHADIEAKTGRAPLVMETDDVLAATEAALRLICEVGFGIAFDHAMLSWQAGPRDEDGPWAPYWYDNVRASTGFARPRDARPGVAPEHAAIYEDCLEDYAALRALCHSRN